MKKIITTTIAAGLVAGVFYCFFLNYLEHTKSDKTIRLLKAIEKSSKI